MLDIGPPKTLHKRISALGRKGSQAALLPTVSGVCVREKGAVVAFLASWATRLSSRRKPGQVPLPLEILASHLAHLSLGCPCRKQKCMGPWLHSGSPGKPPQVQRRPWPWELLSSLPAANCSCCRGTGLITEKYVAPTYPDHLIFP